IEPERALQKCLPGHVRPSKGTACWSPFEKSVTKGWRVYSCPTTDDSEGVCCVMSPDPKLVARLENHGQGHLLAWWDHLTMDEKARLRDEIAAIDFELLDRLIAELVHGQASAAVEPDRVEPIEAIRLPQTDGERVTRRRALEAGVEALAAGEVGIIL